MAIGHPFPSGEQYEIILGEQRAVITEVGATLRDYTLGGRPLLDGFAVSEICSGARGQVLMPWPNRIRDGRYEFGGQPEQLALSDAALHNASHGLVRWAAWRPLEHTRERLRMGITLHPQPGYPFHLQLAIEYVLGTGGLRTTLSAHNLGSEAAPFGAGCHPYLRPRAGLVDAAELRLPAAVYLEVDERLVPTGRRLPVAETRYDFRERRPIGDTVFDLCFAEFLEPWVEFDGIRLSWDGNLRFLQVFSGDTLAPERRRRGLALEPMSCPADAFNSGDGLVVIAPGDYWSGSWWITPGD
jgi:aldose 1-epimerase